MSANLWHIPAQSPDLNPVEKFWNWVRRKLRAMDLADLHAERPAVQRMAMKQRVRSLLGTKKAKQVAKKLFESLRKTCAEVVKKKGAATRG